MKFQEFGLGKGELQRNAWYPFASIETAPKNPPCPRADLTHYCVSDREPPSRVNLTPQLSGNERITSQRILCSVFFFFFNFLRLKQQGPWNP